MRLSRYPVIACLAAAVLCAAGCSGGSDSSGPQPTYAQPSDTGTGSSSPNASAVPAAVSLAAVEAAVAASTKIKKIPDDLTPSLAEAASDKKADTCNVQQEKTTAPTCAFGDLASKKTVVLYGDSHAGMWIPAMILTARRAGVRLVVLEKSACPAPDIGFWDFEDKRANTECDAWHTWAMNKIKTLAPTMTIITSFTFKPADEHDKAISAPDYYAGLKKTVDMVSSASNKVVYLGDIHYLPQPGPDCLAAHESSVQSCSVATSKAVTPITTYISDHAADLGASIVDPTPWFCTSAQCSPIIGKYIVYRDLYHITDSYSAELSGVLGSALGL